MVVSEKDERDAKSHYSISMDSATTDNSLLLIFGSGKNYDKNFLQRGGGGEKGGKIPHLEKDI